jgi:hypothetical protein
MTNPTTLTFPSLAIVIQEIQNVQTSLNVGSQALRNAITSVTTLVDDPNFALALPSTYQAYENWLATVQTAINTLFASIPAPPTL